MGKDKNGLQDAYSNGLNDVVGRKIILSGGLLAKNTLLNFSGLILPSLVGLFVVPIVVRGLGTDRYGILSIAWVVLGYFSILDLGLGRATIKFVADAMGKGDIQEIPRLVWTSVMVQGALGLVGTIILVGITPFLVSNILNIPVELVEEAQTAFYIMALSIPIVLVSGSFSGVLQAIQRFDLFNVVKIPASILSLVAPIIGIFLGYNLPGIVVILVLTRVGGLLAYLVLCFRVIPRLRRFSNDIHLFPRLLAFGGWITVSDIISPILEFIDRFLIGSLVSMTAVSYYSAPTDAMMRLWIVAGSMAMTLFPAFSALEGGIDQPKLEALYEKSLKFIYLLSAPIVLIIGLYAREILQIWLGPDFARESTFVLQVIAIGALFNSLARIPFSLLRGVGRPDIPAKFHLVEVLFYVVVAWFFIAQWGIVGAAIAWAVRTIVDTMLLFVAAHKCCKLPWRLLINRDFVSISIFLLSIFVIILILKNLFLVIPFQLLSLSVLFSVFAGFIWLNVFNDSDRGFFIKSFKLMKN